MESGTLFGAPHGVVTSRPVLSCESCTRLRLFTASSPDSPGPMLGSMPFNGTSCARVALGMGGEVHSGTVVSIMSAAGTPSISTVASILNRSASRRRTDATKGTSGRSPSGEGRTSRTCRSATGAPRPSMCLTGRVSGPSRPGCASVPALRRRSATRPSRYRGSRQAWLSGCVLRWSAGLGVRLYRTELRRPPERALCRLRSRSRSLLGAREFSTRSMIRPHLTTTVARRLTPASTPTTDCNRPTCGVRSWEQFERVNVDQRIASV